MELMINVIGGGSTVASSTWNSGVVSHSAAMEIPPF